jgi:hypothetical protein
MISEISLLLSFTLDTRKLLCYIWEHDKGYLVSQTTGNFVSFHL